jgi:hypothetical protein
MSRGRILVIGGTGFIGAHLVAQLGGANQRDIAEVLLSRSAAERRWRSREQSLRSQAQRLVRSACAFAGGAYRVLLVEARR